MSGRGQRAAGDVRFERRVLASYGPLCELFFYSKLVGTSERNWDHTSRQAAIRNLVDGQPLYLQPESHDAILMVTANGRGVGYLEPRVAGEVARTLREGRQWHAHVRSVSLGEKSADRELTVMMLLMVTPEEYAEMRAEEMALSPAAAGQRKTRDFSIEWTLVAMLLIGVAMTMM